MQFSYFILVVQVSLATFSSFFKNFCHLKIYRISKIYITFVFYVPHGFISQNLFKKVTLNLILNYFTIKLSYYFSDKLLTSTIYFIDKVKQTRAKEGEISLFDIQQVNDSQMDKKNVIVYVVV